MSNEVQYDNVNSPKHYAGSTSLECIEVMECMFGVEYVCVWSTLNAFKYMWRYKNKNGAEDLDKTRWYINYVQNKLDKGFEFSNPEFLGQYTRVAELYVSIMDKIAIQ